MKENTKTGECNRREFLIKISIALSGIAGALVAIPVIGSIIAPLFQKRQEVWRSVGAADSFKIGDTVKVDFLDSSPLPWAGITAKSAAWLRRVGEEEFIAFSVNCAHLGCPVRWIAGAKLFMCPCHGGVYYQDASLGSIPHARA